MENCGDLNLFQIKLEQTELIIKDEPEEVVIEDSALDSKYVESFPTLGINGQLLNTQVEVVPSICRIEDSNNIQAYQMKSLNSKFEMKVKEDYTIQETSIAEDTLESKVNVSNHDFDALEIQLKQEELVIKDEPEQVTEETSSLEIIQFDTIPITRGIRDRIANTQIEVDPSFQCQQCNKCFTRNSSLKRHMLIHKGLKAFKCQQCDRCFTQNSNLKTHMLIHKGLKPFKCQQCDECFSQNGSLKTHLLIHKGLKPFKCQQCNKCFSQSSNLKKHMLIHKGLKPFKCQRCNKCFTQNSSLKSHMLIHKGLKPFKCQQCDTYFSQNGNLKKHMLIHNGLKSEEAA